MTLTLELSPEVERILNEAAQAKGQSVGEYAAQLLSHFAQTPPVDDTAARLEALERIGTFVQEIPNRRAEAGLPPLDDTGISRADFYGYTEREDAQL